MSDERIRRLETRLQLLEAEKRRRGRAAPVLIALGAIAMFIATQLVSTSAIAHKGQNIGLQLKLDELKRNFDLWKRTDFRRVNTAVERNTKSVKSLQKKDRALDGKDRALDSKDRALDKSLRQLAARVQKNAKTITKLRPAPRKAGSRQATSLGLK